jgi:hypothetical protein
MIARKPSDEAIHFLLRRAMDCFASLAMTEEHNLAFSPRICPKCAGTHLMITGSRVRNPCHGRGRDFPYLQRFLAMCCAVILFLPAITKSEVHELYQPKQKAQYERIIETLDHCSNSDFGHAVIRTHLGPNQYPHRHVHFPIS